MIKKLRGKIGSTIDFAILRALQKSVNEIKCLQGRQLMFSNIVNQEPRKSLDQYAVSVFSQFGEDGILDFLCESLGILRPRMVEFGAGDFNECNSRFLCRGRLAKVVLIDKNLNLQREVDRSIEATITDVHTINEYITTENANDLFERSRKMLGGIDIVSIDLDGNDYWILNKLNLDQCKIICLEYNPFFGNRAVSVPYDPYASRHTRHPSGDVYGASLSAFLLLLENKGFTLLGTNEVKTNAFFVRKNIARKIRVKRPAKHDLRNLTSTSTRDRLWEDGRIELVNYERRVRDISDVMLLNTAYGNRGV